MTENEKFNDFINRIYGECNFLKDDNPEEFDFNDFIEDIIKHSATDLKMDFDGDILKIFPNDQKDTCNGNCDNCNKKSSTTSDSDLKDIMKNLDTVKFYSQKTHVDTKKFINVRLMNKTYYGSLVPDPDVKCECVYHHLEDTLYMASNSLEELQKCVPSKLVKRLGFHTVMKMNTNVFVYEIPYNLLTEYNSEKIYF